MRLVVDFNLRSDLFHMIAKHNLTVVIRQFDVLFQLARFGVICTALLYAWSCEAAPEEIQVYMDDMSKPGQFGLDVHNNYVLSGDDHASYLGGQAPAQVYRFTPEFYLGVSDTLELGFYMLTTYEAQDGYRLNGEKIRFKFIAPHNPDAGFYWGANLEIGKTDRFVSELPWNSEIKGILGYRAGKWTFAFTPNIELALSNGGGPAEFQTHSKIAYSVAHKTQVGVESYNEFGALSHLQSLNHNSQTLYAVVDQEAGEFDINVGLGRGLTSESDKWTVKFIVGTHF